MGSHERRPPVLWCRPAMIHIDRVRTPRTSCRGSTACSSCPPARSARSSATWTRRRRAGVHGRGALPRARLDRVDAGVPVRLGAAAVRRHRRRASSSSSAATRTLERMAPHLTHMGVHDHGFNNVSTYGDALAAGARRPHRRRRVGSPVLRAGAEGQRRGAGAALDAPSRRRLHPLVQRRALAVRRHHPLAARARARPPARPAPDGGAGRAASACSIACSSTRAPPRSYNVYHGAAATATTCAGASRTRACSTSPTAPIAGPSTQQGYSPFTTWTRGLAWAMLGFAEQLEFLDDRPRRGAGERAADGRRRCVDARGGARDLRLLHRDRRGRRRALLGHRRAGAGRARRLGRPRRRSVQRSRAGRQLRGGDRGAGPAAARPRPRAARRAAMPTATSRPACASLDTLFDERARISASIPITRACCCTPSITGRTAGTTCRRGARSRAASRASGATTTRARSALYVKRLAQASAVSHVLRTRRTQPATIRSRRLTAPRR